MSSYLHRPMFLILCLGASCTLDFKKYHFADSGAPSSTPDGAGDAPAGDAATIGSPSPNNDARVSSPSGGGIAECDDRNPCVDPKQSCEQGYCVYECDEKRLCSGGGEICVAHSCFRPPPRSSTGFAVTSGGGSAASKSYRLNLTFGIPLSRGSAASPNYRVSFGLKDAR